MADPDLKRIVGALTAAAESGARVAREAFVSRSFETEIKKDGTPVTSADVQVERRIRDSLEERLPGIVVVGEEIGSAPDPLPDRYIALDPIDGTSNFLRGVPFFGVSAAFIADGTAMAGVVVDPMHETTYQAVRGGGAYRDGSRLPELTAGARLEGSTVAISTELLPPRLRHELLEELLRRIDRHQAIRSITLEVTGVAVGWADAAIFNRAAIWDFAAAALVLEEVGGVWSDFEGRRPELTDPETRMGFLGAANAELHAEILALAGVPTGDDDGACE